MKSACAGLVTAAFGLCVGAGRNPVRARAAGLPSLPATARSTSTWQCNKHPYSSASGDMLQTLNLKQLLHLQAALRDADLEVLELHADHQHSLHLQSYQRRNAVCQGAHKQSRKQGSKHITKLSPRPVRLRPCSEASRGTAPPHTTERRLQAGLTGRTVNHSGLGTHMIPRTFLRPPGRSRSAHRGARLRSGIGNRRAKQQRAGT